MNRIILFLSLISLAAGHYFFFVQRSLFYGSIAGLLGAGFALAYAIMASSEKIKNMEKKD